MKAQQLLLVKLLLVKLLLVKLLLVKLFTFSKCDGKISSKHNN